MDVFVMPDDWKFYNATLGYHGGVVVVSAEPFASCSTPTITIDLNTKLGNATLFLSAEDASEIWTALGHAIATSSGKEPVPKMLIEE